MQGRNRASARSTVASEKAHIRKHPAAHSKTKPKRSSSAAKASGGKKSSGKTKKSATNVAKLKKKAKASASAGKAPPRKPGRSSASHGKASVKENKKNGDAAADRIASRYGGSAVREKVIGTDQGARRIDVLESDHAIESKLGRTGFTSRVRAEVRKDTELLTNLNSGVSQVTWEFSRSPITGKIGPTPELEAALWTFGIRIVIAP